MAKILILPFLNMRSGHHAVAETLAENLGRKMETEVKEVEFLSYINPTIEHLTSMIYLNWIRYASTSYSIVYRKFFYKTRDKQKSNEWYLSFFLYKMRCLIQEVKPDLIICTHCFPSHLLNLLKENHLCEIPVINAYTDFFVNQAWGKHQIDYHFLPNQETKRRLHDEFGIHNHRMFVTGIPVHPEILKGSHKRAHTGRMKILIAGGNSGLGDLGSLLQQVKYCIHTDFYVLCGNNKKLFRDITSWHSDHITPIAYVSSRRVMNKLYEEMDALITKPGGVTISEAIEKRIPVFVHGALPGQEEINLKFLINQHLVFRFDTKKSLDEILANTLKNPIVMKEWNSALVTYQNDRIDAPQTFIAEFVQLLLEKGTF